jgi:hypothetical protein
MHLRKVRAQHVSDTCETRTPAREEKRREEKSSAKALALSASPAKEPKSDQPRGNPWVSAYVDAVRETDREPTATEKRIIGQQATNIKDLDPLVMQDAIRLLVERGRSPGALPYLYREVQGKAAEEVARIGGRR